MRILALKESSILGVSSESSKLRFLVLNEVSYNGGGAVREKCQEN